MNWTGGRLRRHFKSNSKKALKTQRDHFAKVRLQPRQSFEIEQPLHFSLFNTQCHSALPNLCESSGKDFEPRINNETRDRKQASRQKIQAVYPFSDSVQIPIASGDLEILPPNDPLSTAANCSDSVVHPVRNDFNSARQALLDRIDWLNLTVTKPLRMNFSPRKEMQRIGRRREVHAEPNMDSKASPDDINEPSQTMALDQERRRVESDDDSSFRTRSRFHQTTRPCNAAFLKLSDPAQPDNSVFTASSLFGERLHRGEDPRIWHDSGMVKCKGASWQDTITTQGLGLSRVNRSVYFDQIDQQGQIKVRPASQINSLEIDSRKNTPSADATCEDDLSGRSHLGYDSLQQKMLVATSMNAFERSSIYSPAEEQEIPSIGNSESTEASAHVANTVSGDDEESWIRTAFATDFDQIQKDFEFHPTPSRRTTNQSTISRFRKTKSTNYGNIQPSQATSGLSVRQTNHEEGMKYSARSIFDTAGRPQLHPNSLYDDDSRLESDVLAHVNNMDDLLNNHAPSTATCKKPISFAHLASGSGASTAERWSRSEMNLGTSVIGVERIKRGRPPSSPSWDPIRPSVPFPYHSTSRTVLHTLDTPHLAWKRRNVSSHDQSGMGPGKRRGFQQPFSQCFSASGSSHLYVIRRDENGLSPFTKFPAAAAYPQKTIVRPTSLLAGITDDEPLGYFQSNRLVSRKADLLSDLRSSTPSFSRPCTPYFSGL